MTITVKKTIEQDEFIEFETPSYWKNEGQLSMLTNEYIIHVSQTYISTINTTDLKGKWYSVEAQKAIKSERITEFDFMQKLFEVQSKIDAACGLQTAPTIFEQNKFRVFQKQDA